MCLTLEFANFAELALCSEALAKLFPRVKLDTPHVTVGAPANHEPKQDSEPAPQPKPDYPPGADALDKTFLDVGAPMTPGDPVTPRALPGDATGEKPQRARRRTNAEMEAARAAQNVPVPGEQVAPAATTESAAVTLDELRTFVREFVEDYTAPVFMALLSTYGTHVKSFKDIPEDKYAELLGKLKAHAFINPK